MGTPARGSRQMREAIWRPPHGAPVAAKCHALGTSTWSCLFSRVFSVYLGFWIFFGFPYVFVKKNVLYFCFCHVKHTLWKEIVALHGKAELCFGEKHICAFHACTFQKIIITIVFHGEAQLCFRKSERRICYSVWNTFVLPEKMKKKACVLLPKTEKDRCASPKSENHSYAFSLLCFGGSIFCFRFFVFCPSFRKKVFQAY